MIAKKLRNTVDTLEAAFECEQLDRDMFGVAATSLRNLAEEIEWMEALPVPPEARLTYETDLVEGIGEVISHFRKYADGDRMVLSRPAIVAFICMFEEWQACVRIMGRGGRAQSRDGADLTGVIDFADRKARRQIDSYLKSVGVDLRAPVPRPDPPSDYDPGGAA